MTWNHFTISKTIRGRLPRLPFLNIKESILGKRYNVSLVFVGDLRSQKLNRLYRGKSKSASILTFPLSKHEGEIFINLSQVKRDAKRYDQSHKNFLTRVFIHGLLHLKGLRHSSTMKEEDEKLLKKFNVKI